MEIGIYMDRLKEIEARFYEYRKTETRIVEQVLSRIVKTVISKGPIEEPFPYYRQRMGVRPGKRIREPVESDWCCRNHYDTEGRLVMVEEYSVFLGRFERTEIYLYGERMEFLLFTARGLTVLWEMEDDLMLAFAGSNGYIVEELVRENGIPQEVRISRSIAQGQEIHLFHYDGQKLALVERICDNGFREVLYTTKKPDFQRIREKVRSALEREIGVNPGFSCLGMEGFLDQQQPMLCLCLTQNVQPPELIADWGAEMVSVSVNDWMFSDTQLKKCVKLIAEVLVELVRQGTLAGKEIRFHQNQVDVCRTFAGARKVFRDAGVVAF